MYLKTIFSVILSVYYTNAAVFLWSTQKFELSPLISFNDDTFEELIEDLGYPEVAMYKSSSLLPELKEFLDGYYTAYNPNGDLNTENATEIAGRDDLGLLEIKQRIGASPDVNVLSVLVVSNGRSKRQVNSSSNTTLEQSAFADKKEGPVFYKAKSKKEQDAYGLLYSSQQLQLIITSPSNTSTLYLGNSSHDQMSVDTANRDIYTRLNVRIKVEKENDIITLRFIFTWSNGYWTLEAVKISDTEKNYMFNLTTTQQITAPARFSYHCSGKTVFSNYDSASNNSVDLIIFDLQTQIDSSKGGFSDAYDCVNFTSGPILSGLFVTAILAIGLIIGITAISDIKTMDKFDNQKTKQLVITVSD